MTDESGLIAAVYSLMKVLTLLQGVAPDSVWLVQCVSAEPVAKNLKVLDVPGTG